jgi:hypothetical protein
MGFTAAIGEPVMCCIVMTSDSKKGVPSTWYTGIDITKINSNFVLPEDEEEMMVNLRQAGMVSGGPSCLFKNINVPCLVQFSPHGGLTPEILTNCLRKMDLLGLFPRDDGKKPFLLLDGHDSWFNLLFLKYIRDDNHP